MSGGIITLWRKGSIILIFSFSGVGYLGVCEEVKNHVCFFINVYSSYMFEKKRKMWNNNVERRRTFEGGY